MRFTRERMTPLEQISVKTITGAASSLGAYAGKVRLVVNVASKCGLTPQYTALEAPYRRFHAHGVVVERFAPDVTPDSTVERELSR